MPRRLALTGAPAAALLDLDGFRDHVWPPLWCAPIGSHPDASVIRTRFWEEPTEIGGLLVAPVRLVLRHLATSLSPLPRWPGDTKPLRVDELVELAVENALRLGLVTLEELRFGGARLRAAAVLASVLARRPLGEAAARARHPTAPWVSAGATSV